MEIDEQCPGQAPVFRVKSLEGAESDLRRVATPLHALRWGSSEQLHLGRMKRGDALAAGVVIARAEQAQIVRPQWWWGSKRAIIASVSIGLAVRKLSLMTE